MEPLDELPLPAFDQRIPLRVSVFTKNQLQTHAREIGTDVNKLIRRAIRREIERLVTERSRAHVGPHSQYVAHICPACGFLLDVDYGDTESGEKKVVKWHTHNGVEVTGDMLW